MATAKNSESKSVGKDILVLHATSVKGKFELIGLQDNGIPSQFRPNPGFVLEHKDFVRELIAYPITKGKERAIRPRQRLIMGPPPVKGLLTQTEDNGSLTSEREQLLRDPMMADLVKRGVISLPKSDLSRQPSDQARARNNSGEPSQKASQHNKAPLLPAGAGESRQNPIPVGIKKEEDGTSSAAHLRPHAGDDDVTDMDMDGESVKSETDDEAR